MLSSQGSSFRGRNAKPPVFLPEDWRRQMCFVLSVYLETVDAPPDPYHKLAFLNPS